MKDSKNNEYNKLYDWEEASKLINKYVLPIFDEQKDIRSKKIIDTLPDDMLDDIKRIKIPKKPQDPDEIMKKANDIIYNYRMRLNNPRFFSFIPNTVSPFSILGEFINSSYNPYGGGHANSSAISYLEKYLMNWMGSVAGYSEKELGGLFVSGGSMANLTASVIARDEKLKEEDYPLATAYVSAQSHSSVSKGIHIMGINRKNVRKIKTVGFMMDINDLEENIKRDIENGYKPFLVVGTAGTTNTGSIDPLDEIADIAEKYNLWFHVDGAYGASYLLSSQRGKFKGIERSDSLTWDAHKMLFQTFGCAIILCKDRQAMRRTYSQNPEYLKDVSTSDEYVNFWDLGIEMSVPARGMRLWFTLQLAGTDSIKEALDKTCENAKFFEEEIKKRDNFEVVSSANLSILNFRYFNKKYSEDELNSINQRLSEMGIERGYAVYYTTILDGKTVLRICTTNMGLTHDEILNILDQIEKDIDKLAL